MYLSSDECKLVLPKCRKRRLISKRLALYSLQNLLIKQSSYTTESNEINLVDIKAWLDVLKQLDIETILQLVPYFPNFLSHLILEHRDIKQQNYKSLGSKNVSESSDDLCIYILKHFGKCLVDNVHESSNCESENDNNEIKINSKEKDDNQNIIESAYSSSSLPLLLSSSSVFSVYLSAFPIMLSSTVGKEGEEVLVDHKSLQKLVKYNQNLLKKNVDLDILSPINGSNIHEMEAYLGNCMNVLWTHQFLISYHRQRFQQIDKENNTHTQNNIFNILGKNDVPTFLVHLSTSMNKLIITSEIFDAGTDIKERSRFNNQCMLFLQFMASKALAVKEICHLVLKSSQYTKMKERLKRILRKLDMRSKWRTIEMKTSEQLLEYTELCFLRCHMRNTQNSVYDNIREAFQSISIETSQTPSRTKLPSPIKKMGSLSKKKSNATSADKDKDNDNGNSGGPLSLLKRLFPALLWNLSHESPLLRGISYQLLCIFYRDALEVYRNTCKQKKTTTDVAEKTSYRNFGVGRRKSKENKTKEDQINQTSMKSSSSSSLLAVSKSMSWYSTIIEYGLLIPMILMIKGNDGYNSSDDEKRRVSLQHLFYVSHQTLDDDQAEMERNQSFPEDFIRCHLYEIVSLLLASVLKVTLKIPQYHLLTQDTDTVNSSGKNEIASFDNITKVNTIRENMFAQLVSAQSVLYCFNIITSLTVMNSFNCQIGHLLWTTSLKPHSESSETGGSMMTHLMTKVMGTSGDYKPGDIKILIGVMRNICSLSEILHIKIHSNNNLNHTSKNPIPLFKQMEKYGSTMGMNQHIQLLIQNWEDVKHYNNMNNVMSRENIDGIRPLLHVFDKSVNKILTVESPFLSTIEKHSKILLEICIARQDSVNQQSVLLPGQFSDWQEVLSHVGIWDPTATEQRQLLAVNRLEKMLQHYSVTNILNIYSIARTFAVNTCLIKYKNHLMSRLSNDSFVQILARVLGHDYEGQNIRYEMGIDLDLCKACCDYFMNNLSSLCSRLAPMRTHDIIMMLQELSWRLLFSI